MNPELRISEFRNVLEYSMFVSDGSELAQIIPDHSFRGSYLPAHADSGQKP